MERQFIKVTIEDRVAMVTIDHPPANSLNTQTVTELDDAISVLGADPGVKVIIITGGGAAASSMNVFVAGADIGEIQSGLNQLDMLKVAVGSGQGVLSKIEKLISHLNCQLPNLKVLKPKFCRRYLLLLKKQVPLQKVLAPSMPIFT